MGYVTLIVKFSYSFKSVSKTDVCEIMVRFLEIQTQLSRVLSPYAIPEGELYKTLKKYLIINRSYPCTDTDGIIDYFTSSGFPPELAAGVPFKSSFFEDAVLIASIAGGGNI